MTREYAFEGLPVEPVRPGTSLLVAGDPHSGTESLALSLLAGGRDEGTVLVTTNRRAARVLEDCSAAGMDLSRERTAIIDCVGDGTVDLPAVVESVSGPGDLTGIGIAYSNAAREFEGGGVERVRTGVVSVSTLLSFSDLQTVSRFVHTLVGRIEAVGGIGVLMIDPVTHDDRAVRTIAQFCDGRVDVREGETGGELRVRGIADQPQGWVGFEPRTG